jgi:hypothetical protein
MAPKCKWKARQTFGEHGRDNEFLQGSLSINYEERQGYVKIFWEPL